MILLNWFCCTGSTKLVLLKDSIAPVVLNWFCNHSRTSERPAVSVLQCNDGLNKVKSITAEETLATKPPPNQNKSVTHFRAAALQLRAIVCSV